jgi:hypothetical protein
MTGILEGIEDCAWDGTSEGLINDTTEGSLEGKPLVSSEGALLGASTNPVCDGKTLISTLGSLDGTPDGATGSSEAVGINETFTSFDGNELLKTDGDSDGRKLTLESTLGETEETELGFCDTWTLGPSDGTPEGEVGRSVLVGMNDAVTVIDGTKLLTSDGDSDGEVLALTLGETEETELGFCDTWTLGPSDGTPDGEVGRSVVVGLDDAVAVMDGNKLLTSDGDSDGEILALTLGETDKTELGLSDTFTLGPIDGTPNGEFATVVGFRVVFSPVAGGVLSSTLVGRDVSINATLGRNVLGNRVGYPGPTIGLSVTFDALGNIVVGWAVSNKSTIGGVVLGNRVGLPGVTLGLPVSATFEVLGVRVTGIEVGRAMSCFKALGNCVG